MTTLGGFAQKMRKASKAVLTNTDKLVKEIACDVLAIVVNDTPVDVGTAKSNWHVGIDNAPSMVQSAYDPGEKGSTEISNIEQAIAQGEAVIATYAGSQEIHITNNLDYINDLNSGSSNQAPPGYVQDAVLEALGKVQKAGFSILHNIEV